jgi:hypothetical protein
VSDPDNQLVASPDVGDEGFFNLQTKDEAVVLDTAEEEELQPLKLTEEETIEMVIGNS